jgi:hypothetical protein
MPLINNKKCLGLLQYEPPRAWKMENGAYVLPLQSTETIVTLRGNK